MVALKRLGDGYTTFDGKTDISKHIENGNTAKKILSSTIKLPNMLSKCYNIDKTIKELEDFYINNLRNWDDSVWLKGSLCAMFDEEGRCSINGVDMEYNEKYGLIVKGDKDGQV